MAGELPGLVNALDGYPREFLDVATIGSADTVTVVNTGGNMAQELRHLPQTRTVFDIQFAVTEAAQTVPWKSGVKVIDLSGMGCNYISVSPSVRGNAVYVCVDQSELTWAVPVAGGNFYPVADIYVPGSAATVLYPLPVRENRVIAVTILPAAFPYADVVRLVAGYLPGLNEQTIYEMAE